MGDGLKGEPRAEMLAQSRLIGEQSLPGYMPVFRIGKFILLEWEYALSYYIVHQRAFLCSLTNYAE